MISRSLLAAGGAVALPACLAFAAAAPDGPAPGGGDREVPAVNRAILEGAKIWLARGARYDAAYFEIPYPDGDVPQDRGACVDLIVRALRHAGIDLQRLLHEDRAAHPAAYVTRRRLDPNLDHRLTVNHLAYFRRHARSLTTRADPEHLPEWLPGDLVYYGRSRVWHAGVVSDRASASGVPYIIDSHQDAGGVSDRYLLTRWGPIIGHFRVEER
ncbi:MAG: DUF1287 domain-containing protein [Acidobacteria bacterium]|nr:DUF1287 domain-containing protein [Acidobacteriota bacterium]